MVYLLHNFFPVGQNCFVSPAGSYCAPSGLAYAIPWLIRPTTTEKNGNDETGFFTYGRVDFYIGGLGLSQLFFSVVVGLFWFLATE